MHYGVLDREKRKLTGRQKQMRQTNKLNDRHEKWEASTLTERQTDGQRDRHIDAMAETLPSAASQANIPSINLANRNREGSDSAATERHAKTQAERNGTA